MPLYIERYSIMGKHSKPTQSQVDFLGREIMQCIADLNNASLASKDIQKLLSAVSKYHLIKSLDPTKLARMSAKDHALVYINATEKLIKAQKDHTVTEDNYDDLTDKQLVALAKQSQASLSEIAPDVAKEVKSQSPQHNQSTSDGDKCKKK